MGDWFAGVVGDLATEAVRGVWPVALDPACRTPAQWQLDAYAYHQALPGDYPAQVSRWVAEQVRVLRADQERRDRNAAMLLWGVHL